MSDVCGALLKGIAYCATCDVAMTHTYTQKKGQTHYRYYVCGRAHRQGRQLCETRSVSAPMLEGAVIRQLAQMAADTATDNPVRNALSKNGSSWEDLTEDRQRIFIRTVVRQVRYDGPSGTVTLRFCDEEVEGPGE